MRKLISILLVAMFVCSCLVGCDYFSTRAEANRMSNSPQTRFEVVASSDGEQGEFRYHILVDTETNILYLWMLSGHSATSGLTVLWNENGTPMTLGD